MKRRRNFFRRHFIAIMILVCVAAYAIFSTLQKQATYNNLVQSNLEYEAEIMKLKEELGDLNKELDSIGTRSFYENYAKEHLNLVKPNQVYYDIRFKDQEDDDIEE